MELKLGNSSIGDQGVEALVNGILSNTVRFPYWLPSEHIYMHTLEYRPSLNVIFGIMTLVLQEQDLWRNY